MSNLAGKALPYIEGLGSKLAKIGQSHSESAAGNYIASMIARPFSRRTALGAIGGAIAGGVYGGASDNHTALGGAIVGAGLGAAGGRYGGMFMKQGMTRGVGIGTALDRTMASGWSDFRKAQQMGRSSAGLIGNTLTTGMGRIRGLFR